MFNSVFHTEGASATFLCPFSPVCGVIRPLAFSWGFADCSWEPAWAGDAPGRVFNNHGWMFSPMNLPSSFLTYLHAWSLHSLNQRLFPFGWTPVKKKNILFYFSGCLSVFLCGEWWMVVPSLPSPCHEPQLHRSSRSSSPCSTLSAKGNFTHSCPSLRLSLYDFRASCSNLSSKSFRKSLIFSISKEFLCFWQQRGEVAQLTLEQGCSPCASFSRRSGTAHLIRRNQPSDRQM